MGEYADSEAGFGFMRALGIARPRKQSLTSKKALAELDSPEVETLRDTAAKAQDRLRDKAAEQHGNVELWPLPGLAPMTRVRTSFGDVHAIALRKGDEVLLKSGQYRKIEWINRIMLDEHILNLKPDSNPVLLASGSLGAGLPAHDIMVSPRQVFCADDRTGLAKPREASMLVSRGGIRRFRESSLSYTMFHVGETADVYCEGVYLRFPIES